ncbi:helix-turn-helix domain-containing protein [Altererythrobacter luteolus]|uniref:Helix-turn-helix domain-containing protein n=1 Tax=Pontixanthobacter luteolus TaxID=295089 RepID=A0A6I4V1Z6_9SPHN|nr:helix-turn-helix transcriptional regulator [Pontixanthobacter luteolus]MXP48187.1 helix-turn-helix domain-containing protein [Pontixanthobacter luteolus]
MAIAAHFDEQRSGASRRGEPRRTLRLQAGGERSDGADASVTIHNASRTGLLIESETALEIGEVIAVALPEGVPVQAEIVWESDQFYGCRFKEPISEAALSAAQLRSEPDRAEDEAPESVGESFGARLKRLRLENRLTMEQVAKELEVTKATIWSWEHGRARPRGRRIGQLAELFDAPLEKLSAEKDRSGLPDILARSREEIAEAFGTSADKVRIMIEL